jgi:hypothetical protein
MFKVRFLFLLAALLYFLKTDAQNLANTPPTVKHANKIDKITSAKEIEHLLKSIDKDYARFKVNALKWNDKSYQKLCDSLNVQSFTKADFDNNGYTDMLVIGEYPFSGVYCIMDSGKNKFEVKMLSPRYQDCLPVVSKNGDETFITNYFSKDEEASDNDTTRIEQPVKLIYKFGGFIEHYDSLKNYNIEKIEYSTTMCFGTCPVFSLVINSDRTAEYFATQYNNPNGKFKGTIDKKNYEELIHLLNYMDFPGLEKAYRVNWTDDQGCTLTITYNGGKTKVISDYGKIGTHGLMRVYEILFAFREDEEWTGDIYDN